MHWPLVWDYISRIRWILSVMVLFFLFPLFLPKEGAFYQYAALGYFALIWVARFSVEHLNHALRTLPISHTRFCRTHWAIGVLLPILGMILVYGAYAGIFEMFFPGNNVFRKHIMAGPTCMILYFSTGYLLFFSVYYVPQYRDALGGFTGLFIGGGFFIFSGFYYLWEQYPPSRIPLAVAAILTCALSYRLSFVFYSIKPTFLGITDPSPKNESPYRNPSLTAWDRFVSDPLHLALVMSGGIVVGILIFSLPTYFYTMDRVNLMTNAFLWPLIFLTSMHCRSFAMVNQSLPLSKFQLVFLYTKHCFIVCLIPFATLFFMLPFSEVTMTTVYRLLLVYPFVSFLSVLSTALLFQFQIWIIAFLLPVMMFLMNLSLGWMALATVLLLPSPWLLYHVIQTSSQPYKKITMGPFSWQTMRN